MKQDYSKYYKIIIFSFVCFFTQCKNEQEKEEKKISTDSVNVTVDSSVSIVVIDSNAEKMDIEYNNVVRYIYASRGVNKTHWIYKNYKWEYNIELYEVLKKTDSTKIDILDIDAHGSPTNIGDLNYSFALEWAKCLREIKGFTDSTKVYLDGCNTGIPWGKIILAQLIANGAHCKVYGSLGYLKGNHIQGKEECRQIGIKDDGTACAAIPGSIDANGDNVWCEYNPNNKSYDLKPIDIKLNMDLVKLKSLSINKYANTIYKFITNNTKSKKHVSFPNLRIAPEFTITIIEHNVLKKYNIYIYAGLIQVLKEKKIWKITLEDAKKIKNETDMFLMSQ